MDDSKSHTDSNGENSPVDEDGFIRTAEEDMCEEKLRLLDKFENVDGRKVRFWSEEEIEDTVEEGDWLVRDGGDIRKVDSINIEEYDRYYVVQEFDDDVDFEGWLCYADMKLIGQYDFEDLFNYE
jgi:hypothetical protein